MILVLGISSKIFFGISLASIMVLAGFSFSDNFLPEADAYVSKYSNNNTITWDYIAYKANWIDAGTYGWDHVQCNDGDTLEKARLYSRHMGTTYNYITDHRTAVDGVTEDGDRKSTKTAIGKIKNDTGSRSYFYVFAYCSYN